MDARAFAACLAALFALGCSDAATGSNQPSSPALDADENALLFEVNRVREANNIPGALVVCSALNASASLHSDDMRDKGYVAEKAPDGSHARDRACDAGYTPACGTSASVAELVARGITDGAKVVEEWSGRADATAVLLNTVLVAAGAGRSVSDDGTVTWTLDLASADDPSCK